MPEVIVLGSLVMYEVLYDENSVLRGGRKIIDSDVIKGCRGEVERKIDKNARRQYHRDSNGVPFRVSESVEPYTHRQ